ncbi:MAG: conjugal transfer protein TraB [Gammaproteobacteria bacterium RIFCSPHIGHO2_12_FULL_63_22]|nr:MAG: conjugal transfer protein TraB [Gammaproteobacteria bacterium RIFCSPHIGHO2_12_FULL_63_22]
MDNSIESHLQDQPHAIVERDGVRFTLLGTAHVSRASIDAVKAAIASGSYDTVAVELDPQRHRALTDPQAMAKLDLFQIIREGKIGLVAANLALAAYQRRLAEQLGVEPGAELKAAAIGASESGLVLQLIDRDVGTTLKRAWSSLGFWGRSKLMAGLAGSLFVNEQVDEEEIEKLKQGDILEASFGEFATQTPQLFEAVIAERDRYMAARLREGAREGKSREVLAVVGAGHLKGLAVALAEGQADPATTVAELDHIPEGSRVPWFTLIFASLLLGGFAWGFHQGGIDFGAKLVLDWVLITAIGGAIGCAAAGGHPLSILAAALASPITPLVPALSSGMVSAFTEAWVRKPTYQDMLNLRQDTDTLKGWWRNRFARVFVNFVLANAGTSIAVWIAGANLLHKLG